MTTWLNCLTCNPETPVNMNNKEIMQHLKDVHKLKEPIQGIKSGKIFLDGANGYHRQEYEWDLDGVKVYEIWESGVSTGHDY